MSDSKVNVYHITKWYPNEEDDLEGIFIPRYIRTLVPEYRNFVFYGRRQPKQKSRIKTIRRQKDGLYENIVYYRDKITGIGFIDRLIKLIFYFRAMTRAISQVEKEYGKGDIIHVHVVLRSALLGLWLKRRWNVPMVITEHWSVYHRHNWLKRGWIWRKLVKYCLRKADHIMPVSRHLARAIEDLGILTEKTVIYNVVDTEKFHPPLKKTPNDPMRFIHVSDFSEFTKNVKGILNAFKKLAYRGIRFELVVVGYGPYENEIKAHAESLGYTDDLIRFTGKLKGDELVREMQAADAFVMFSRYENLPCVLIEAMSCGLPVVSSNVGGIPEIVHDFNGRLVDSEDEEGLADRLMEVIEKKEQFNREKIREFAVENFSMPSIGTDLDQLYKSLS